MMRSGHVLAVMLLWLAVTAAPLARAESQTFTDSDVPIPVDNLVPSVRPGESVTLDKIRKLGAVYLGHREVSVPFSYVHEGHAVGYSVDLCHRIIDGVKRTLGRPDIATVDVPLSGNLRFTTLIDGIADLECGVSTNTKIRQQRMAFSVTTFVSSAKVLVKADSPAQRINDLDGKIAAILSGTTAGRTVATAAARRNISIRQTQTRDRLEAFDLIKSGKADLLVSDDALILGVLLADPDRDKFRLMDEALSIEPYGIALRRDDPEFKKLVDEVLTGLMKSGEMEKIYDKWFMQPVPPSGKSMNLPLSPMLKELFANPNDAGV